jgi:hypothetical protein
MDEKSKTSEKSLRLVIPGDAIDEIQNISDDIKGTIHILHSTKLNLITKFLI